ncbi:MAG: sugar ABC transporter permease [Clostridia bacterium]|nr:sugar ABC transporter permease [Clostridia bacterium]
MSLSLQTNAKKPKLKMTRMRSRMIFYCAIMALPILQFCIFYIYTHINSFVLAFQDYAIDKSGVGYNVKFVWFENFKVAIELLIGKSHLVKNSLITYVICNLGIICLSLIFSFYIYKSFVGHNLFRVILFMPQIISSVVFAILFEHIANILYPDLVLRLTGKTVLGLLKRTPETIFITLVFFSLWIGFGANVLLFTGSMSGIDQSLVESANLDGANILHEFWFVTLPMIFPTIITFLVTGIAGIFNNQMALYTFYGGGADPEIQNLAYYIYVQTRDSDVIRPSEKFMSYSEIVALGLFLTAIVLPLSLGLRKFLEKYGPRVD